MGTANFTFDIKTIGKLLKAERMSVPVNQRSYKWDEIHIKNLLQDFDEAISNDDRDYFLGTIVLVQHDRGQPSIQDGQQRLATTSILLARIRDKLYAVARDVSAGSIDSEFIRNPDRNTEAMVSRLTLNEQDNDYFVRGILIAPNDKDHSARPTPIWQSNTRLETASKIISEFLDDKLKPLRPEARADLLLKWVTFIEQSASVVVVTASDEVNAYRIFETLNDRGLKASQADILKNYFFSKSSKRLSEAQVMWNIIAGNIESIGDEENETLVTYIRHLWITTHGPTKERELAAKIKLEVTGETKTMQFLSDGSRYVSDYLALSNPKHQKWSAYKPSVRKSIEIISEHLQVAQIRPLMFAVTSHFDPIEAEKAFRLFVSWSVRFLIYGGRGGMLDHQYSLRAQDVGKKQITKARELREAMDKHVPNDAEFEEAFATARVSRPHLARYYLRALEKTRTADPNPEYVANEDVTDVSLEHILPLELSSEWSIDPDTTSAAQKLLGNMVLLKATQNRDLGNKGFDKKKAVFGASGYYTTRDVAGYAIWTMDEIRDRQRKLAAIAVKTWTLKFDD